MLATFPHWQHSPTFPHFHLSTFPPFNVWLRFFLLNSNLSTVVAAGGTCGVVDVDLTAVRAFCQCGCYGLVVSSALESASFGLSSFRMCHFDLLFGCLLFTTVSFRPREGISRALYSSNESPLRASHRESVGRGLDVALSLSSPSGSSSVTRY